MSVFPPGFLKWSGTKIAGRNDITAVDALSRYASTAMADYLDALHVIALVYARQTVDRSAFLEQASL